MLVTDWEKNNNNTKRNDSRVLFLCFYSLLLCYFSEEWPKKAKEFIISHTRDIRKFSIDRSKQKLKQKKENGMVKGFKPSKTEMIFGENIAFSKEFMLQILMFSLTNTLLRVWLCLGVMSDQARCEGISLERMRIINFNSCLPGCSVLPQPTHKASNFSEVKFSLLPQEVILIY